MKQRLNLYLLFLILCNYATSDLATSMVYNFRIAQVTKQPLSEEPNDRKNTIIALLFDVYQKKYNGPRQNFTGALASYIRDFAPYYVRLDFAFSHIKQNINHQTNFTGNETDDLLLTTGCKINSSPQNSVTLSTLCGIPTHRINTLQHPDFGYNQVGLGLQLDGIHNFDMQTALVYGTRYIYFIPRTAYHNQNKYKFSISNLFDLLVASKTNWGQQGLEAGYTARFQFGAQIYPNFADIIEKTNCIRSNFYLVYKYKFAIQATQNRLLLNIGYGFDHKPKTFGNKNIITVWGAWSINF